MSGSCRCGPTAAPQLARDTDWLKAWASPMLKPWGLSQVTAVDVRSAEAFRLGHVPLALNLPAQDLSACRRAAWCCLPTCRSGHHEQGDTDVCALIASASIAQTQLREPQFREQYVAVPAVALGSLSL